MTRLFREGVQEITSNLVKTNSCFGEIMFYLL